MPTAATRPATRKPTAADHPSMVPERCPPRRRALALAPVSFLAACSAAALLLLATPAARGDVTWSASSGDWSVASNWGGAVPGFADNAYIANGGTASITVLDGNATCLGLYVGDTASGAAGALQMSDGNLSSTTVEYIGNMGTGAFNQSGGSHNANAVSIGNNAAAGGIYNLSGSGILSASTVYVGNAGSGTFNQAGGTCAISDTLTVGSSLGYGNFNLSAGSLWALSEQVGGLGVFSQSGGTHTSATALALNSGGSYALSGGVLQLPGIGGSGGSFSFSGGTLATAPSFTTNQNMTLGGSGGYVNTNASAATFAGALSGSAGLYVFGGGTLTLATSNGFSGGATVSGSGTTVLLSDPNALQNSTLTLTAKNVGLAFDTGGGNNTSFNLGGLSGSGNASLVDSEGNPLELVVGGNGASTTYNGVLSGSGGSLTKVGSGTLVLGASNTYTDGTSVNGGALLLDFSQSGAPTSSIVSSSSSLSLGGGTLAVQGKASANNTQEFAAGLTVNPGGSAVVLAAGASGKLLLNVGSITRMPGGTIDFTTSGGTQSATNGIATSNTNTNGILGGYATCGGTAWATVNASSDIVPLTSYTTGNLGTTNNGAANVSPSGAEHRRFRNNDQFAAPDGEPGR